MSSDTSLVDKESITLGRYLYAAFDLFKQGVTYITGNDSASASAPVTERTLASAGLTPISTRVTRQVPTSPRVLPQISTRIRTPLKVPTNVSKITPAEISEIVTRPLTAPISAFPSVLLGSGRPTKYGSSSSYAEYADSTYQGVAASSSLGIVTPVIRPPTASSYARPTTQTVIGSSSSYARPTTQTVIGSSSSYARPTTQTVIGSSSSYARPVAQTVIGGSSSYARPVAQTGVGSSSSSSQSYGCYITGYTSPTGEVPKKYTLPYGTSTLTFDILLSVSVPPHYCPGTTVVNQAALSTNSPATLFRNNLGKFVSSRYYSSAIDFLYYHAIDNALMNPVAENGQNGFATFELLSPTFMYYCLLEYNANRDNVMLDSSRKTEILSWFNKLNTTYTEPYKSYNTNTYYLYACKQIAYLHITNAPYSSYNDIITNITNKFQNNYPVRRTTATNTFITLPYIETVNGTRTASLKMYGGTNGTTIVSDPNSVNVTVTYNNDNFLSTELREQKSLSYHDYYLKLCFAALIVLKAKGAPASFFNNIKSNIKAVLDTLMKPNADKLYGVWSGFTQEPLDQKTKDAIAVTNKFYLYIFENGTLPTNWLSLYNINGQTIEPVMASKQFVI